MTSAVDCIKIFGTKLRSDTTRPDARATNCHRLTIKQYKKLISFSLFIMLISLCHKPRPLTFTNGTNDIDAGRAPVY